MRLRVCMNLFSLNYQHIVREEERCLIWQLVLAQ